MNNIMIPEAKVQTFVMSDREYRGANPEFLPIKNVFGMITGWRKVRKGVPFRRRAKG